MFVLCTVRVCTPVSVSPGDTLTGADPEGAAEEVSVYVPYSVAGSDPVAATTSNTLNLTEPVDASNTLPISVDVSAGSGLVDVSSLINSYSVLDVTPPGLTDAPSLNKCLPSLPTSV